MLVQPETVKINSILEVQSEPSFRHFKKFSDKGTSSWEVSEEDFITRQFEKERARLNGNIKYYQDVITNLSEDPNLRAVSKKKRTDESEMYIELNRRMLTRLDTPEGKDSKEHTYKNNYLEIVKEAIKHGEPVPDEVVEQKPEFQVAKNSRQRYEKGLHTSFANKSAAVNAVMFHEKGYKVKRQDGKPILDSQIAEIDNAINEVQEAVGPTKDMMQKSDLTIAHTSGTFPFLNSTSLGIYHPAENTITTGVQLLLLGKKSELRSLAHEFGHWLDYQAGGENKKGYEFYTNGKSSRRVKSYRSALSKEEEYSNGLFKKAEYSMNNSRAVRLAQNPSQLGRDMTEEEKAQAREWTARIGSYYRDSREIWARLVEQYVAEQHGKATTAAESPEYYEKHPAYWNKGTFNEMKPTVKAEIERRTSIARGT